MSPSQASAQLFLPCKKNLTYYKFELYSRGEFSTPSSVGSANILAVTPFSLVNYYQVNEKLFFEVDRQIEFELLSKSFTMACNFGASTLSSVMINEFH